MKHIIEAILITIGAFFMDISLYMIAVTCLIIIDTMFGVLAARKNQIQITSRKFSMVLIKLLVYNLLIISAKITEDYLVAIPFVKIVISFIGITEFISIGESFTTITGKNFVKYLKEHVTRIIKRK